MKLKTKKILLFGVFLIMASALFFALHFGGNIFAHAENNAGSGLQFVIEKNPIERVEIVAEKSLQLRAGESVGLSCKVYPDIAMDTVENISYKIARGDIYANLQGRTLTINRKAPIGSTVSVVAVVDGVVSENSLTFTVVETPVERIEIIAPSDTVYQGAVMHLGANVFPEDATDKSVTYSIVDGDEYADINFNGTVAVTRNLPYGDLSVTVRAASTNDPTVYAERTFALYKPVVGITSANTDLKEVEQKRSYSFAANAEPFNATFGDKFVYYSLNVDESVATIDENGLLYVTENAPIGQEIIVRIDAADGVYYEQTVTVIPVYATGFSIKDYTEPNESGAYLPDSVIDFDVEFFGADNISECNKNYYIELSDSSFADIVDNCVIIKSIEDIAAFEPSFTVTLYTNQNGTVLSDTVEVHVYIPVTEITLTANTEWVTEGCTYFLIDLFTTGIYPLNSNMRTAEYHIVSGDDIAYLDGNKIVISDNLPSGNLQIKLMATAYDKESEILVFNAYNPTDYLKLSADKTEPISAKAYGEKVVLYSETSETATANGPIIRIIQGAENIASKYQSAGLLTSRVFELKNNLANQRNFSPVIVFEAEQDGIVTRLELMVYIPNENIVLSTSGGTLTRGALTLFSVSNTPNATESRFEVVGVLDSNIEKFDINGQTIQIKQNTKAGTKIKVKYRSIDKLKTQFTAEFTVAEIISNQTPFDFKYNDTSKTSYSINKLYGVIDKDSDNIAIVSAYRQLHTGRSTTLTLNYEGRALSDYGLSLYSVSAVSDNIEVKRLSNDKLSVTVKDAASGISGENTIEITVCIKDGDKPYNFNIKPLYVFRPMSGDPILSSTEPIVYVNTQLYLNEYTFDTKATYSMSDLQFSCSENGNGVRLTQNGYLTIEENCTAKVLSTKVSCDQTYNNTTITYERTLFDRKVRWITLKDTLSNTSYEVLGVGSFSYKIQPKSFGQYIFGGYYTYSGGGGTQYYDENGELLVNHPSFRYNTTLYAKWSYNFKVGKKVGNDTEITEEHVYLWDRSYDWKIDNGDGFERWSLNGNWYSDQLRVTIKNPNLNGDGVAVLLVEFKKDSCVVEGTMITLADGTQKAVEDLDGSELVLAWDFRTGKFVSTPVIFVVNHGEDEYEVINLYFSDGTKVGVIYEHGFFDYDLNKYVFLRSDADKYIGHYFNQQYVNENGEFAYRKVQLVGVEVTVEITVSYSPLTSEYLCYYVNGMLSVSAKTDAFVNMFDFDGENMLYASTLEEDIALYGLFTYEDFKDLVSEEIFEAFNAKYLKISIGKGLTTWDEIIILINRYMEYLSA